MKSDQQKNKILNIHRIYLLTWKRDLRLNHRFPLEMSVSFTKMQDLTLMVCASKYFSNKTWSYNNFVYKISNRIELATFVFSLHFSHFLILLFCCCCWTSINISTREFKFSYYIPSSSTISQYTKKNSDFFFKFNFQFVSFHNRTVFLLFFHQEHRVQAHQCVLFLLYKYLTIFRFKLKLIEIHLSHIPNERTKH